MKKTGFSCYSGPAERLSHFSFLPQGGERCDMNINMLSQAYKDKSFVFFGEKEKQKVLFFFWRERKIF